MQQFQKMHVNKQHSHSRNWVELNPISCIVHFKGAGTQLRNNCAIDTISFKSDDAPIHPEVLHFCSQLHHTNRIWTSHAWIFFDSHFEEVCASKCSLILQKEHHFESQKHRYNGEYDVCTVAVTNIVLEYVYGIGALVRVVRTTSSRPREWLLREHGPSRNEGPACGGSLVVVVFSP